MWCVLVESLHVYGKANVTRHTRVPGAYEPLLIVRMFLLLLYQNDGTSLVILVSIESSHRRQVKHGDPCFPTFACGVASEGSASLSL